MLPTPQTSSRSGVLPLVPSPLGSCGPHCLPSLVSADPRINHLHLRHFVISQSALDVIIIIIIIIIVPRSSSSSSSSSSSPPPFPPSSSTSSCFLLSFHWRLTFIPPAPSLILQVPSPGAAPRPREIHRGKLAKPGNHWPNSSLPNAKGCSPKMLLSPQPAAPTPSLLNSLLFCSGC